MSAVGCFTERTQCKARGCYDETGPGRVLHFAPRRQGAKPGRPAPRFTERTQWEGRFNELGLFFQVWCLQLSGCRAQLVRRTTRMAGGLESWWAY